MTLHQPATTAADTDVPSLPWGQIADTPGALDIPTPIPDAYRHAVAQVCAAIHQNLPTASPLAQRLAQDLADRHGGSHPYALSAHELVAHHHYQTRDYVHAAVLYLALAECWRRHLTHRHPYYKQVVTAAYCAWSRIQDPDERQRLRPEVDHHRSLAGDPAGSDAASSLQRTSDAHHRHGVAAGPPSAVETAGAPRSSARSTEV